MRSFYIAEAGHSWILGQANNVGNSSTPFFESKPAGRVEFHYGEENGKGWFEYFIGETRESSKVRKIKCIIRGTYESPDKDKNIAMLVTSLKLAKFGDTTVVTVEDKRPLTPQSLKEMASDPAFQEFFKSLPDITIPGKNNKTTSGKKSISMDSINLDSIMEALKTQPFDQIPKNHMQNLLSVYAKTKEVEKKIETVKLLTEDSQTIPSFKDNSLSALTNSIETDNTEDNVDLKSLLDIAVNDPLLQSSDIKSALDNALKQADKTKIENRLKLNYIRELIQSLPPHQNILLSPASSGKESLDIYRPSVVSATEYATILQQVAESFPEESFQTFLKRIQLHQPKIQFKKNWVPQAEVTKEFLADTRTLLKDAEIQLAKSDSQLKNGVIQYDFSQSQTPDPSIPVNPPYLEDMWAYESKYCERAHGEFDPTTGECWLDSDLIDPIEEFADFCFSQGWEVEFVLEENDDFEQPACIKPDSSLVLFEDFGVNPEGEIYLDYEEDYPAPQIAAASADFSDAVTVTPFLQQPLASKDQQSQTVEQGVSEEDAGDDQIITTLLYDDKEDITSSNSNDNGAESNPYIDRGGDDKSGENENNDGNSGTVTDSAQIETTTQYNTGVRKGQFDLGAALSAQLVNEANMNLGYSESRDLNGNMEGPLSMEGIGSNYASFPADSGNMPLTGDSLGNQNNIPENDSLSGAANGIINAPTSFDTSTASNSKILSNQ
jgi:hypothetical protein